MRILIKRETTDECCDGGAQQVAGYMNSTVLGEL